MHIKNEFFFVLTKLISLKVQARLCAQIDKLFHTISLKQSELVLQISINKQKFVLKNIWGWPMLKTSLRKDKRILSKTLLVYLSLNERKRFQTLLRIVLVVFWFEFNKFRKAFNRREKLDGQLNAFGRWIKSLNSWTLIIWTQWDLGKQSE